MAKKKGTGVNIGSISILVIFVILCLTTFATLSLVSANSDSKLSSNTAGSVTSFYKADSAAEELLAEISEKCLAPALKDTTRELFLDRCVELKTGINKAVSYTRENDRLFFHYSVPIDDKSELQVSLEVIYPDRKGGAPYKLTKWTTVSTAEWIGDESLNVWPGE